MTDEQYDDDYAISKKLYKQLEAEPTELIEKLAEIEHDRWSRWHEHASINWTEDNVLRWDLLANTSYSDLSEPSKESDRREVRKYWSLIQTFIASERLKAKREVVEIMEKLQKSLKAEMQMRDFKSPRRLVEELAWVQNDELARKWSTEALSAFDAYKESLEEK